MVGVVGDSAADDTIVALSGYADVDVKQMPILILVLMLLFVFSPHSQAIHR